MRNDMRVLETWIIGNSAFTPPQRVRPMQNSNVLRWVVVSSLLLFGSMAAAQPVPRAIEIQRTGPRLELVEVLRLGSLEGPDDAFGRIMDATIDGRGRILVADGQNHRVSVYDRKGTLIAHLGRRGRGPGEFEAPWRVAVEGRDSILVWDASLSRVSVFSPELRFVRSFRLPPQWLLTSMVALDDGRLLVAAYGSKEDGGIHFIDREGSVLGTFGPTFDETNLGHYTTSLLGGYLTITDSRIIYTQKSPYEVHFFDLAGRSTGRCVGRREWTTAPVSVVRTEGTRSFLDWNRFVHSSHIVALGSDRFLNVLLDPVQDRLVLDVLTPDCKLLRRTLVPSAVGFSGGGKGRLLGVAEFDYPQLIVYEVSVRP